MQASQGCWQIFNRSLTINQNVEDKQWLPPMLGKFVDCVVQEYYDLNPLLSGGKKWSFQLNWTQHIGHKETEISQRDLPL